MDALKREKEKERSTQPPMHAGTTNAHHVVHSAVLTSPEAAAQAINSASPEEYRAAAAMAVADYDSRPDREDPRERFIVLLTWAICCYGIQALFEKQKKAEAEATEFAVRQERLHTAGRLAAEIAHQIKNPLGIITNAAFCLQRSIHEGSTAVDEQVQIIREEIHRADQIITELMGYAQLAEGVVEKLEVDQEVDQAILDVFPRAAKYDILIRRDYAPNLPALLMQKRHFSGVLVNILQNAREAMDGHGQIDVTIRYDENDAILITIADNGPGIPADKTDKIFQAYFTTRAKGTGLGLAIVKHNTEMYGGTVHVESELGKGTRFQLKFPARILMKLNK
ncbi:MAG: sensor histidine kinase, partial [Verrucomicrobiales bacterium]|nr:sensor histidine kinase [Verrucomicrobiales bacterium]